MAENKKSFLLYADQKELFEILPNDVAGKLIKHIFAYVNDENPKAKDKLVELAFVSIKQHLKRDLVKYEKRAERSKNNGKLGGRPKRTQKTQQVKKKPKEPDNVNVNVNDNVNVIQKEKETLLTQWINYRRKIKKAIKPASMNLLIDKFNDTDKKVLEEAITKSIENGYQGLFTENQKSKQRVKDTDNDFA